MSAVVSHRLQEIAERGVERRRRMLEIRQQASRALEVLRPYLEARSECAAAQTNGSPATQTDVSPQSDVLGEVQTLVGQDVLRQVESLLSGVDAPHRDHWNEDDALIMFYLQEVWAAARRSGYTEEDLQLMLRLLGPFGD